MKRGVQRAEKRVVKRNVDEIARKFKLSGVPIVVIAMNTGLSEEEITGL